ncbi:SDR family oxidoreductase, partial [Nostoc sp. NIES-2111]
MASNVVMITGASSGIGLATARLFLERGWCVLAGMRTPAPEKLSAVPDHRLMVLPVDVTVEASIEESVELAAHRFGKIDVLVNSAGYGLNGPLEGWAPGQLEHQFDVNLFGLVAVTRHVLPLMRAQRSGVIVNVSSIGGRFAFPFASAYHGTKFAVEGLSESLRFELAAHGVRVKIVEPGGIRTNFISGGSRWASHHAY